MFNRSTTPLLPVTTIYTNPPQNTSKINTLNMKILEIFENKLRVKNYSTNTIKVYKQTLKQYLKEISCKDPYQISTKEIIYYLESKSFSSIAQQNQFIGCLKLFARYILNKKDIHLDKIERPRSEKKLPRVIEKEFLLEKLSKIENVKHKAILTLAYSTGMRVSEVCNLKIEDIDSKRMLIYVKNGKGRKDRIVPLTQTVLNLLRQHYKSEKPIIYLFNGQNKGDKYTSRSCNQIVKKYLGGEYHFHLLRHSNATAMLEAGTDLRYIQSHLGHSSSKTTEIYTHISTTKIKNLNVPI